jgi:DNA repair exonuclease SbcCD ATPase subunit
MGAGNFRKKLQDPVSLFSFQDIIIGVTGILIMFTLILIISSQKSSSSADDLTKDQIEKLEALQKLMESLMKSLSEIDKDIQAMGGALSPEQLQEKMKQLEEELAKFQKQIDSETSSLEEEIKKRKEQVEQIKQQTVVDKVELEKLKEKLKELSRQTLFLPGEDRATDILVLDVSGERCEWFWRKTPGEKSQFPAGDTTKLNQLMGTLDKSEHQVVIFCRPSGVLHFRKYQFLADKLELKFGTDSLTETQIIQFDDGK